MSHSQSIDSHKEIKRRCTCWKGRQATSKKPFKKMFGWRHPLVKVPLWTLLPAKYRRQRIDWVHERRLINSSFDCLSKFSHADKRGWRRAKAMDFSFFFFLLFFPLFFPLARAPEPRESSRQNAWAKNYRERACGKSAPVSSVRLAAELSKAFDEFNGDKRSKMRSIQRRVLEDGARVRVIHYASTIRRAVAPPRVPSSTPLSPSPRESRPQQFVMEINICLG